MPCSESYDTSYQRSADRIRSILVSSLSVFFTLYIVGKLLAPRHVLALPSEGRVVDMVCSIRDNSLYRYGSLVKSTNNHNDLLLSAISLCDAVFVDQHLSVDIELNTKDKLIIGGRISGEIVLNGIDYVNNKNVSFMFTRFDNALVSIRNYFNTSFLLCEFSHSTLELYNTRTWTERTAVIDCGFHESKIVFRKPSPPGTDSYMYTNIIGCWFRDSSIVVEEGANASDSSIVSSNFWFNRDDQCGLCIDGHMFRTLVDGVVFESFVESPSLLYGVRLGQGSTAPYVGLLNFLGEFTAMIYNPHGIWIHGSRSIRFREVSLRANQEAKVADDYGGFGLVPLRLRVEASGQATAIVKYLMYDHTVHERTYTFTDVLDIPVDVGVSSNIVHEMRVTVSRDARVMVWFM